MSEHEFVRDAYTIERAMSSSMCNGSTYTFPHQNKEEWGEREALLEGSFSPKESRSITIYYNRKGSSCDVVDNPFDEVIFEA